MRWVKLSNIYKNYNVEQFSATYFIPTESSAGKYSNAGKMNMKELSAK